MRRHPAPPTSAARPTRSESRIPVETQSCGSVDSAPRHAGSAHSAMYVGTAAESRRAAGPPPSRPALRTPAVGAHAIGAPPSRKSAHDAASARLRPARSASALEPSVPAIAPKVVELAISPVTAGRSASPNSGSMSTSAPAITPVLKPCRMLPSAAPAATLRPAWLGVDPDVIAVSCGRGTRCTRGASSFAPGGAARPAARPTRSAKRVVS